MKALLDASGYPKQLPGGVVPMPESMFSAVQMVAPHERTLFFENLRLNLQGRILSLSGDELIKLQGKLEYLTELENLFASCVK